MDAYVSGTTYLHAKEREKAAEVVFWCLVWAYLCVSVCVGVASG